MGSGLLALVSTAPPVSALVSTCKGLDATIIGTDGPDVLIGTIGRDVIVGNKGSDLIYGWGGDDVICGGDGDDWIHGGDGNDLIYGNPGNDAINGGKRKDVIHGGEGRDSLVGESGEDVLYGGDGIDGCEVGNPFIPSEPDHPLDRTNGCERDVAAWVVGLPDGRIPSSTTTTTAKPVVTTTTKKPVVTTTTAKPVVTTTTKKPVVTTTTTSNTTNFNPKHSVGQVSIAFSSSDVGAVPEKSGVATSPNFNVVWTHPDGPTHKDKVVALDRSTGSQRYVMQLTADIGSWEDISVGPGPIAGRTYLYLFDIGDNAAKRGTYRIHRVLEPLAIKATASINNPVKISAANVDTFYFQYSTGSGNATWSVDSEAAAVDPLLGTAHLVEKEGRGGGSSYFYTVTTGKGSNGPSNKELNFRTAAPNTAATPYIARLNGMVQVRGDDGSYGLATGMDILTVPGNGGAKAGSVIVIRNAKFTSAGADGQFSYFNRDVSARETIWEAIASTPVGALGSGRAGDGSVDGIGPGEAISVTESGALMCAEAASSCRKVAVVWRG